MFAGRIHMLATVLGVMASALFVDKKVPYFPIEVSRMAASGPVALLVFRIGCCSLLITTSVFDGTPSPTILLLCISLAVIAVVDDVTSWIVHMMGVLGLFVSACIQVHSKPVLLYTCLLPAGLIYITRVILKGLAVHFLERKQTMATLFDSDVMRGNVIYAADIMFGKRKAIYTETALLFSLGGFLQWVVFLFLAPLF